jgi:hypothetical protein
MEGAADMQQIGIALHGYANMYRGDYPLAATAAFNFAAAITGPTPGSAGVSSPYPSSYNYLSN